jgi:flagellar biosynthesis protein FlhF
MRIKRYLARDMQEAVALIKQDMGPEAIIISSRRVRGRGLWGFFVRQLEVTAALDERRVENAVAQSAVAAGSTGTGGHPPAALSGGNIVAGGQSGPGFSCGAAVTDLALRRELAEVKCVLHRLADSRQGSGTQEQEPLLKWRRVLAEMEVEAEIIDELLAAVEKEVPEGGPEQSEIVEVALLNRITQMVEPCYQNNGAGRVIVFIGPTGVGKTTTLAKLAAQYRLFYQKNIALVTIDTYRIGAVEQLRAYAEIIGVPLEVVLTPQEMRRALETHAQADHILIDTAGRPSKNREQVLELKTFLEAIPEPRDIYLVLSCNTKYRDLLRVAEDFSRLNYNKLIFTKLDETESPGVVLNLIKHLGLPAVYVTGGQSVPDDIDALYPKKVAKLVLKGGEEGAGSGA